MLQVAKVLKSNGTDGGVLMGFRDIDPRDLTITEPVFIYFDGLPVPFFIKDITPKGNDKAIVHLHDVNTLKDAEEIVGSAVFSDEFEEEDEEESFRAIIGWTLKGVGKITDFINIPSNPCIEVQTKNGAALIPLHEDLIISVDEKRGVLEMSLPDGLLDL